MWSQLPMTLAIATGAASQSSTIALSGSHTNIPRWCGKPYMAGSPNFPPGGMLHAPAPAPSPLLFVQLESRHSIYDSSESTGQFIVEASISYIHGEPYTNASYFSDAGNDASKDMLSFDIKVEDGDEILVSDSVTVSGGPQLFDFDLTSLRPRLRPYKVELDGSLKHTAGSKNFSSSTDLYYLPAKKSGSTVKIDNLYGGMLVANNVTDYAFEPLLPYGFYASCSGYLNYSLANVTAYKDHGFNAINPVCAFTDGDLGFLFDWLDEANLWYQYDMRGSYMNLSSVMEQIPLIKDRSAFLSWYTADEPDGWQYPLNSTVLAYDLLKQQDPYHPTGLVLNCDNYYFNRYSAGADYLMEDAYPVGINPTYSRPWNTTCNETYGDCGCDDCLGELQDVSNRLDAFFDYQEWLGRWQKPLWAVLQAFSGEGYWSRDPTTKETWAMIVLSFNHMAKAIMSWVYPPSSALIKAHSEFAKVATVSPVSDFLIGADPVQVSNGATDLLDVAYWVKDYQIMVGIVILGQNVTKAVVEVDLPFFAKDIHAQPWGSLSWKLDNPTKNTTSLVAHGVDGLATSLVILET